MRGGYLSFIRMEDKGCTKDDLYRLYVIENKTFKEIESTYNVSSGVVRRWFKENNIPSKQKNTKYSFDKNVFDDINTEEKAYWLGFLWCDGYVQHRTKKNEYSTKLQLAVIDKDHLERFRDFLKSNHPIHTYKGNSFGKELESCRLMISNVYFGKVLQEKYGLIPNRYSISKLLSNIPKHLLRHFYRGVFDAEGSMNTYYENNVYNTLKATFGIYTYEELIDEFQNYLIHTGIKDNKVKTHKRHEDRDGMAVGLKLSGTQQVSKVMSHLYDRATIYLLRKYKNYQELKQKMEERNV